MKPIVPSLTLIAISGAIGLVLSGGHAALRPDVEWVSVPATGTGDVSTHAEAAKRWTPGQHQETDAILSAQWARRHSSEVFVDTPVMESDLAVAAPTESPRPKPRSTVVTLDMAGAFDWPLEASDQMSYNGGFGAGAATGPIDVDGIDVIDPSAVSLATFMSKGPVAAPPVPNYMHGVFR